MLALLKRGSGDWGPRERGLRAAGAGEVEHLGNLGGVMKVLETVAEDADLTVRVLLRRRHPAGRSSAGNCSTRQHQRSHP